MYCAYVTRIHNLRKHTNADRLLCGECFGNTVIVDLGTDPEQLGVYFPKQLHHALRLREFMTRYEAGEPYAECLISHQCEHLKEVKRGCYSLEEARALMSAAIQSMTEDKKRYMDTVPVSINQHANEVLQKATVEILKRSFLKEIQGGE